jgi:pantoate--beta-alanine ligase
MGMLHKGHISLIKRARLENRIVVVSVYVNPLQFGINEDFEKYPRSFKQDIKKCRKAKVDILFAPKTNRILKCPELHDDEASQELQAPMCGRFRIGHFKGVVQIVACLLRLIKPSRAYFGQKDYQQYRVMREMSKDIFYNSVDIICCPIIREKDGLAMSSRNKYLKQGERKKAPALYKCLKFGERLAKKRVQPSRIISMMREKLTRAGFGLIDYFVVTDPETLKNIKNIRLKKGKQILIAGAAHIGNVRLIDNILINSL